MFSKEKRKEARMDTTDNISIQKYNLTIGAMLAYGFVMNIALVLFAGPFVATMNPTTFLIGYLVLAIIGSLLTNLSRNPIVSFLGYNMICVPIGAMLSVCLPTYPVESIISAIAVTVFITVIMMVLSMMFPNFFSRLGIVLFLSLLIGVIAELIAVFAFGYGGDIFSWIFIIIFSLYIGFDWHKAQSYPKTIDNAIDSAVDLYLDIINLFVRLLEIFTKKDD